MSPTSGSALRFTVTSAATARAPTPAETPALSSSRHFPDTWLQSPKQHQHRSCWKRHRWLRLNLGFGEVKIVLEPSSPQASRPQDHHPTPDVLTPNRQDQEEESGSSEDLWREDQTFRISLGRSPLFSFSAQDTLVEDQLESNPRTIGERHHYHLAARTPMWSPGNGPPVTMGLVQESPSSAAGKQHLSGKPHSAISDGPD